ncbi:eukaryotic translation initiation factor 2C, 2 [Mortierella sp. GBA43]|nr:eukaryotic translation initiation factor 2C, 2 [Mortierella sp. GBA43]
MATLTRFIERPDVGTVGQRIRLRTNFFKINRLPDIIVHHYDVSISPEAGPKVNRPVFKALIEQHGDTDLGGARPVYDGRKNIFSPREFPFQSHTFEIVLPEEQNRRQPRPFRVKIRKVASINLEEVHQFVERRSEMTNNIQTAIMSLDVLMRHKPSLEYTTVGRSFYTPQGSRILSGGVEVWDGFYQSVRPTISGMMVNLDITATAFWQSGPLLALACKLMGVQSVDDFRRGLNISRLDKAVRGLDFRVTHRGEIKQRFKIQRLTPTAASATMFEKDGAQMDVATYFFKTYNRRLAYPFMPCVVARKDIFLPMEVCSVIEGQRFPKKLDEKQTADMIKHTCQPPSARANKIKSGLAILKYNENEFLRSFGVEVSTEMAQIRANFVPQGGAWNLRDKRVAAGATLGSWGVVVFSDERRNPHNVIKEFIRELIVTCVDTGMVIVNKEPPITYASHQSDIEGTLKSAWLRAGNAVKSQPQLLVCLLPMKAIPLYAEIKRVSDTVIGIPTQCLQLSHTSQPKKQYCANVCLKMNVKLGGMNSFLSTPPPFLAQRPTIIFGADVSHPPPNEHNRPSIASLVGSMDSRAARYAATVRVQTARTETIADLGGMVVELLKTFYQTCGEKPERVLFYRDGVSDGQFAEVLDKEVASVLAACRALDPEYRPTITFVVVQKRHHTRFFPERREDSDRSGNCHPGTVIDTDIVHPIEFDFYLQSQAGLQGTSRPTHYHVLKDENHFTPDALQDFTYKMCYLFARCTRTVSVVPPAYYAHMVAARARFHAKHERWSDTESTETSQGSGFDESAYLAVRN